MKGYIEQIWRISRDVTDNATAKFSQILQREISSHRAKQQCTVADQYLLLQSGHLLGLTQRVHGNGEEHVEERVVAEHGQKDEVERVDQARLVTTLATKTEQRYNNNTRATNLIACFK